MSGLFESSAAGMMAPDTVLECGVCWWQYDPATGDESRDIPAGTAFADLPADWRCPSCDNAKSKFMLVDASDNQRVGKTAQALTPHEAERRLVAAFEKAEESMVGLPIHNDRLQVEAVGFRVYGETLVGVMITPWSMNLVSLPLSEEAASTGVLGSTRLLGFPSGGYQFLLGRMDGVGLMETCSLFSPMDEFDDPAVAREAALAALEGLFEAEEAPPPKELSRRFLFTMNGEAR